jgi:hypothetical protein
VQTAVSITTCPRSASYVEETALALAREGAAGCAIRLVVVDGRQAPELPGWDVRLGPSTTPQGVRATMWRAFGYALTAGADRLIYCEDDIVPCKNAIRWIQALDVPDDGAFVDFHDMELGATAHGLHPVSAFGPRDTGYYGNQCMLFPRRTLEWLVRQDPQRVRNVDPPNHADAVLGHLLARSVWPRYYVHLPRLVRHVGAVSAAHPARDAGPETRGYPGDDFDALTLF